MLSSFKICSAFCEPATYWQPKRYKNKGKLQEKTTLKNHAICVKSPCILHEITACFDADSNAISVKTQCKMIEMRASKLWNGFAQVQKLHFHFYLVSSGSVKNRGTIFTKPEENYKRNRVSVQWCRLLFPFKKTGKTVLLKDKQLTMGNLSDWSLPYPSIKTSLLFWFMSDLH